MHPPFDTQRLTITKGFERLNGLKVCLWESSMQNAAKSPCRQSFELRRGRSFVWIGLLTALAPQCPRLMTPFEMRKGLQTLLLSPHCTSETHAEDLRPPPQPTGSKHRHPFEPRFRAGLDRAPHTRAVGLHYGSCLRALRVRMRKVARGESRVPLSPAQHTKRAL